MRIKAITLWQPWAALMAAEHKRIETRGWKPSPGQLQPGDLLTIHAAKSTKGDYYCNQDPIRAHLTEAGYQLVRREWRLRNMECASGRWNLPLGAVLCIARYEGACPVTHIESNTAWREGERPLGDYTHGRWGWVTSMVLRLPEPIQAKGAQGIWQWEVPAEVEAMLEER